ncbi:hypothetical protein [Streptomyces sp. NPDC127119]|uniref:hypothetical protein n=1 Tax=Streptomyces sp. NPDC127119 TaxID=3345370 RepID=UPI00362D235A
MVRARRIGAADRTTGGATEDTKAGLSGDPGDVRGMNAEVGEIKVVDIQPGEIRVVDVQLGESRIADARPGEPGSTAPRPSWAKDPATGPDGTRVARARQEPQRASQRGTRPGPHPESQQGSQQGSSTATYARLAWDAVTVGAEASPPAADRQASDEPVSDQLLSDQPVPDQQVSERSAAGQQAFDRTMSDRRISDRQAPGPVDAVAALGPVHDQVGDQVGEQLGEPVVADRTPAAPAAPVGADPVKALMHRHRQLCERAVDPLEIAAALEAHGVTDRTATHFRHRDVFSLAEEMYARVPRAGDTAPRPETPDTPKAHADWAVLTLLPGALCAAVVTGLRYTEGRPRLAVTVVGVLAVALAVRAARSRGPLHATRPWSPTPSTRAWTYWLVAYALLGDGLLAAAVEGGPDGPPTGSPDSSWPIALASVMALSAACAPAAWCAHLFTVRARRRLATSRALEDFASSVKPLLLGVFALFLCVLGGLLALSGAVLDEQAAYAGAGALGALLLLARLLTVHGFRHAPAVMLAAAGVAEALALLSVFASRLPGCAALAVPVETVADAWGVGAIPALGCGAAALVLLLHATRTLTRASAHAVHGDMP